MVLVAALAALAMGAEPGRWMAGVAMRTAVPAGMLLFGATAKPEVVAATLARPGPTASPARPSESKRPAPKRK